MFSKLAADAANRGARVVGKLTGQSMSENSYDYAIITETASMLELETTIKKTPSTYYSGVLDYIKKMPTIHNKRLKYLEDKAITLKDSSAEKEENQAKIDKVNQAIIKTSENINNINELIRSRNSTVEAPLFNATGSAMDYNLANLFSAIGNIMMAFAMMSGGKRRKRTRKGRKSKRKGKSKKRYLR
jgi:hypothetical protein